LQKLQLMPLLSLASVKSRLVLPFWYRLTRVVLEKVPLNARVCVCVCVCVSGKPTPIVSLSSKRHMTVYSSHSELVSVQLLQSFCLPVIFYGLQVTQPQKYVLTMLNNLINRAVYKFFKVSDKDVICYIRQ